MAPVPTSPTHEISALFMDGCAGWVVHSKWTS